MSKKYRSHQLILNQMKECMKKEGLVIYEEDRPDFKSFRISSRRASKNFTTIILCSYHPDEHYVEIRAILGKCASGSSKSEMMGLANFVNSSLSLFHLALCPDCGSIELRTALFVLGKDLPDKKFQWLLNNMIKIGELIRPHFDDSMPEEEPIDKDPHEFPDTQLKSTDLLRCSNILDSIEGVMKKLKLPINADSRSTKHFCLDFGVDASSGLVVRLTIEIEHDFESIIISMSPWFDVPEEKIPVVQELICRVNQAAVVGHMYLLPEMTSRAISKAGVLMTEGILDIEEFERVLSTFIGNCTLYFKKVKEQLSSPKSPKALLDSMFADKCGKHA